MSILSYLQESLLDENQAVAKQIAQSGKSSFTMDSLKELKSLLGVDRFKYLGWIAKNWESINHEKITSMIDTYESLLKRKSETIKPDINQYKSVDEFLNDIENEQSNPTLSSVDTSVGSNKLIYDQNNIKIYRVLDKICSIELGKGTSWCTARDDDKNMFDHYTKTLGGEKYVLLNGNLSLSDPEHKIGIVVTPEDTPPETFKEFQNTKNTHIDSNAYYKKWNLPPDIMQYGSPEYVEFIRNIKTGGDISKTDAYIKQLDDTERVAQLTRGLNIALQYGNDEAIKYFLDNNANISDINRSKIPSKSLTLFNSLVAPKNDHKGILLKQAIDARDIEDIRNLISKGFKYIHSDNDIKLLNFPQDITNKLYTMGTPYTMGNIVANYPEGIKEFISNNKDNSSELYKYLSLEDDINSKYGKILSYLYANKIYPTIPDMVVLFNKISYRRDFENLKGWVDLILSPFINDYKFMKELNDNMYKVSNGDGKSYIQKQIQKHTGLFNKISHKLKSKKEA